MSSCTRASKRHIKERIKNIEKSNSSKLILSHFGIDCLPSCFYKGKQIDCLIELNLSNNLLVEISCKFNKFMNLTKLDISRNKFLIIPECIYELSNLEILLMDNNYIREIQPLIGNLRKLTTLSIKDNKLSFLPKEITKLLRLRNLNITGNRIPEYYDKILSLIVKGFDTINLSSMNIIQLPDYSIDMVGQLQSLTLSNNKISNLSIIICNLVRLRVLELRNNEIYSIPDDISKLKNLEVVGLSKNHLSILPDSFSFLNNLTFLNLSHNNFTKIPSILYECLHLKELYLGHNNPGIKHLSNDLCKLEYLKILAISHNQISEFPTNILLNMKSLQSINLSNNPIESIEDKDKFLDYFSPAISNGKLICGKYNNKFADINLNDCLLDKIFIKLIHLGDHYRFDISKLNLSELPNELQWFSPAINILNLSNNIFNRFPFSLDYSFLLLESLDISNNQISIFPDDINDICPNLTYFNCSNNNILVLPNCLQNLCKLKILLSTHNKLTDIPLWIVNLKYLQHIDLSYNLLEDIPDCIYSLCYLQVLHLSNNSIKSLSKNINNLLELHSLYLHDNNITSISSDYFINLNYLEELTLNNNQILSFDINLFYNLKKKLKVFNIHNNPYSCTLFRKIIQYIYQLELYKDTNTITNITNNDFNYSLDLSSLNLNHIPKELEFISSIEILLLESNNISDITSFPFYQFRDIKELYINLNQLSQLPDDIENLQNLCIFAANFNRFIDFPIPLLNCLNLKEIYLSNNQLHSIPTSIKYLNSLEILDVSYNLIQVFPVCLFFIETLKELSLSYNKLQFLPYQSNIKWNTLEKLELIGNTIISVNLFKEQFPLLKIVISETDEVLDIVEKYDKKEEEEEDEEDEEKEMEKSKEISNNLPINFTNKLPYKMPNINEAKTKGGQRLSTSCSILDSLLELVESSEVRRDSITKPLDIKKREPILVRERRDTIFSKEEIPKKSLPSLVLSPRSGLKDLPLPLSENTVPRKKRKSILKLKSPRSPLKKTYS